MFKALVIVDAQVDFCEGGSLAVEGGAQVVKNISDHMALRDIQYKRIVATKDWHVDPKEHFSDNPDFINTWPPHCVVNTPGAEFHSNLDTDYVEQVFYKGMLVPAYSGFEGIALDGTYLSLDRYLGDIIDTGYNQSVVTYDAPGIKELDICGIATDYCVRATVMDGLKLGFKVNVLVDLCAAVDQKKGYEALTQMDDAGANIIIGDRTYTTTKLL